MIRPSACAFLLLGIMCVSCEDDYPYELQHCHCHGNSIGGWDDSGDSTVVQKKETTGGLEITVDDWGDSETHDINL